MNFFYYKQKTIFYVHWKTDVSYLYIDHQLLTLLEKAKLGRKISDGKNEISHKFVGRKI